MLYDPNLVDQNIYIQALYCQPQESEYLYLLSTP